MSYVIANGPLPLWNQLSVERSLHTELEVVNPETGIIECVSRPTLSVFLPDRNNTGMAIVVFPGGGYQAIDWKTHVLYTAQYFNAKGVAVIGLKYRTRPPYVGSNEDIQAVTLEDAKRALRTVRHRAEEWQLDAARIGVLGFSAGANLALNLASEFDYGKSGAMDLIERESCRPDFVISIATWHWGKKESPFLFSNEAPPVYFVHAYDDTLAPIELPLAIKRELTSLNVPAQMAVFSHGGHGIGNLTPEKIFARETDTLWPDCFLRWFEECTPSFET